MTVEVTKSGTISGEMTVGAEAELGAVIAKAKVSVRAKIAASVEITNGHRYSHDVRREKYGHLQYGSWGYKVSWEKYRSVTPPCPPTSSTTFPPSTTARAAQDVTPLTGTPG
ncbi:hypothetical protein [Streptomyces sp. MN13]